MTLIRKINGIPINEITYVEMTDGLTHLVNKGSMMGAINMFGDDVQRYVFTNYRGNRVTVRHDCIREVKR
mgnify:CR=1 FL=1